MLQNPSLRNPIAVSLGAVAGALSRYGTFFINLSGCFVMGFFATLALDRVAAISKEVGLLVATGFLGAYTVVGGSADRQSKRQNLWLIQERP